MNHPQSIIDSHQHVNWHRRDAKGLISARDRYPDRFLLGYSPNPAWPTAPELWLMLIICTELTYAANGNSGC